MQLAFLLLPLVAASTSSPSFPRACAAAFQMLAAAVLPTCCLGLAMPCIDVDIVPLFFFVPFKMLIQVVDVIRHDEHKPLNSLISKYEPVDIAAKDVLYQHPFASSPQPHRRPFAMKVSGTTKFAFWLINGILSTLRSFDLELEPNTDLFHYQATIVERTGGQLKPIGMEDRQFYRGHIRGQQDTSSVHMRIAADGTCHGIITTQNDTYSPVGVPTFLICIATHLSHQHSILKMEHLIMYFTVPKIT